MNMNRTIEQLQRDSQKVYIYLPDAQIQEDFLLDAAREGYRFGTLIPDPADHRDNIIALGENKTLAHPGFVGRIAFQTVAGGCLRVDYKKYRNGEEDYLF